MCKFEGPAGRLNILYQESKLSLIEFSKLCKVSPSAMKNYLNGRLPQSDQLRNICEACSVSADWLLCMSEVRSTSPDIQNAIAALGLSEKAVTKMKDFSKYADSISSIIESNGFIRMVSEYSRLMDLKSKLGKTDPKLKYDTHEMRVTEDGNIIMSGADVAFHFFNSIGNIMSTICEEQYFDLPAQTMYRDDNGEWHT